MKTIGFCIPCYNEEENITRIYTEIKKQMKDIEYEYKFYLLIINQLIIQELY